MVLAAASSLLSDGAKDPRLHSMGQSFSNLFSSGKGTLSALAHTIISLRYLPALIGSMWMKSRMQIIRLSKQLGLRHPAMEKLFEISLTVLAFSSYLGLSGFIILVMCLAFSALAASLSVCLGFVGGSLFIFSSLVGMIGASIFVPVIGLSALSVLSIAISAIFSAPQASGTHPTKMAQFREIYDEQNEMIEASKDAEGRVKAQAKSLAVKARSSPVSHPEKTALPASKRDTATDTFSTWSDSIGERKARQADLDVSSLSPESQAALAQGKAVIS
jgi:hypothetical protein